MEEKIPKWKRNKRRYNDEYNKEHALYIRTTLYSPRDDDLIAIWRSIPNKADWLREQLRKYKGE